LARDDRPLDAYPFDTTELTAVAALPLTGLRGLMDGRATTIVRRDEAHTARVELRPDQLIPQPYLPLLADRAEQLLNPA